MANMPIKRPYLMMKANDITLETRGDNPFFTVKELAKIYGFPSPSPSPKKTVVGVISFGGGLFGTPANITTPYILPPYTNLSTNDIQKNWAFLGYSAAQMPQVIIYPVGGAKNDIADINATGENTLDLAIIGGACPNANLVIVLYLFPNSYLFTNAFQMMLAGFTLNGINYSPTIISISWGAPELAFLYNGRDFTGDLTNVANILKDASQMGIAVCAASGDAGSTDGNTDVGGLETQELSVDFPASCPYIVAVGGTTLSCPNKVYDSVTREIVWNNKTGATGGGTSAFYDKPSWQQANQANQANKRMVPDIALNSDPMTGLILYFNGQLQAGWGGTSMAAPLFAALLALSSLSSSSSSIFTSSINSLLYQAGLTSFYDIVTGNNDTSAKYDSYSASKGYDMCSGLGSINGKNLSQFLLSQSLKTVINKPILVSSLSLIKPVINMNLTNARTFQLTANVNPANAANKNLTWLTNNPNVATISKTGFITAKQTGSCLVAAFSTDGSNKNTIGSIVVTRNMVRGIQYF